ncbi:circadian-associated transcriptional repressor [Anomaloglossus baeobatrachus]|uniref:circadian-associated transcriptional repressor n=1 Tax=Anomaloglossus baeobatrachus TaxID=238106 RepID=UPI003F4FEA7A
MEDTASSDFLSSCDSLCSASNSTTTDPDGHKYVDFDVFLTDSMEESSNKTEEDFETSHMIPNSRLTSADHPVLIRLESEYQARRSFWLRRSGQHLLYPGEVEGRRSSCNDQSSLINEESALQKPDKQRKRLVLKEEEKLEAPQGLKRQRKPETELTSSWWRDKESSLQVTEGDRIFAQKCRELQGFIKPLTNLLNGLKRGRYERGLSSFQQSVAMDRIQRIVGVLQKPEMGERYLGTLLQVEMMLKVWFPDVTSSQSSFSSSSSDYDMEEPRYKMAKPPDVTSTEKRSSVLRSGRASVTSPPDHPAQAPLHPDCACCRERAQVLAQWPNMNMTWMHTAPICNPPLSQVDLHHLNRALGQDLFGPNAPSCGVIFFVQNSQPSSPVHPIPVAEVEKSISPFTDIQENPTELALRCQSAPALAQHAGTQSLDASKLHSHSLPLLPAPRPDGENT